MMNTYSINLKFLVVVMCRGVYAPSTCNSLSPDKYYRGLEPTALLAPTPSPTHEPSPPKQWAPSSITYSAEQVCGGGWQPCCWVGTRVWEGSRRDAEHRNNNHIDWHPTPMNTHAKAKAQAPPNAKAQGPKPLPEFMRKQTGTHI